MRDRRFVAAHRGGPLSAEDHRLLARWAVACARRGLPRFQAHSDHPGPAHALEVALAWADGEATVGQARAASTQAHAAAREVGVKEASEAARAAGHAVATAHMADHSLGAAIYTLRALAAAGEDVAAERAWQLAALPAHLAPWVTDALDAPRFKNFAPR